MAFSQLGYQYIRPIYSSSDRQGNGGGGGGGGGSRPGAELSPSGALSSVLSSMYGAPYAAAAAAQGYGAFLPYAAELPIFPQLGAQYDLKDSPGVQHAAAFSHPHAAFYPYGQYQFGDPSRPKNATRESTSTLKAWLNEHRKNPYPTKGEKIMLAIITKMTLTQVSTWFANARRRLKKENKMTWAPRSRTDEEEEGNAYGSEREEEEEDEEEGGGKRGDPDDEEIDLENLDGDHAEESALAPPAAAGPPGGEGGRGRLLDGEDDDEEEEGLEEEEREEDDAGLLPSDAKASDSDASDGCLEDFPGGRARLLLLSTELEGPLQRGAPTGPQRPPPPPAPPRRLSSPASPPTAPSPALPPPPPPKPKIWSLAETATSPDNPARKSPSGGGGGGGSPPAGAPTASPGAPSSLQLVGVPAASPAAPAHRLVSACPLGKFAATWASGRPFSAHHHHHHPHPLSLLNTPHLLGLAGGSPSAAAPNAATAAAAAAAALAAFSRPPDQAQSAEAAGGTDLSSALEVEKKLIKTAFQPVQRRTQNQLDAAMVLSALSSS